MKDYKKHKENFLEYAILSFAFFPLIPNAIKGLPVVLLLIAGLVNFSFKKPKIKLFIIFSFLYILYLLSLSHTTNWQYAFKKLETALSMLIIPLVFFVLLPDFKPNEKLKIKFIKLFVLSTSLFSIISILAIWFNKSIPYYKDFYSNKFRTVVNDLPLIGQHPIYASFFLAVSILFTVYLYYHFKKKYLFFSFLLNLTLLLMLSSKGIMLSLIIIILIFLLFVIKIDRKIKLFSLFFIGIGIMSLFLLNRRMHEMLLPETYKQINKNYSNSYRVAINSCSINLIKKQWLFGYGMGDVQQKLDECYTQKNITIKKNAYNSHNQYFDAWLRAGVAGFIYLILFISYLFYTSLKRKNYLLLALVLLYSINFLFENILLRQSGVILFYFLIIFFFLDNNLYTKLNYKK